jgi:excisionase family DNA binding protein
VKSFAKERKRIEAMKLLRGEEVAKELNISRSQAFTLMKSGRIPTIRIGKLVRVKVEDLEQFVEANRTSVVNTNLNAELSRYSG